VALAGPGLVLPRTGSDAAEGVFVFKSREKMVQRGLNRVTDTAGLASVTPTATFNNVAANLLRARYFIPQRMPWDSSAIGIAAPSARTSRLRSLSKPPIACFIEQPSCALPAPWPSR
jgi:hypothetical protein